MFTTGRDQSEVRTPISGVLCISLIEHVPSIGDPAFFDSLLHWCPPSRHAYVVFPRFKFSPKSTPQGQASWSLVDDYTELAGQQRDLFYADGDSISYAGTFVYHSGPRSVKLTELSTEITEVNVALTSLSLLDRHAPLKIGRAHV